MRKVSVTLNLSLDGVMQAPGRPDEDTRGGFQRGGWALPYNDPVMGRVMGEGMAQTGALLLGRRTYEDFAGYWPHQKDNPFTEVLDNIRKYVASRTLTEPLPWKNSSRCEAGTSSTNTCSSSTRWFSVRAAACSRTAALPQSSGSPVA